MERVRLIFAVEVETKILPQELSEEMRRRFESALYEDMRHRPTLYGPRPLAMSMAWRREDYATAR
jgi:hypothetical protein